MSAPPCSMSISVTSISSVVSGTAARLAPLCRDFATAGLSNWKPVRNWRNRKKPGAFWGISGYALTRSKPAPSWCLAVQCCRDVDSDKVIELAEEVRRGAG